MRYDQSVRQGPYPSVQWQQKPKYLYGLSKSTVSYKMSLINHEKIREMLRRMQLQFPKAPILNLNDLLTC
jgi:hypothetical protein